MTRFIQFCKLPARIKPLWYVCKRCRETVGIQKNVCPKDYHNCRHLSRFLRNQCVLRQCNFITCFLYLWQFNVSMYECNSKPHSSQLPNSFWPPYFCHSSLFLIKGFLSLLTYIFLLLFLWQPLSSLKACRKWKLSLWNVAVISPPGGRRIPYGCLYSESTKQMEDFLLLQ